jgi:hypothetical protein
MSILFVENLSLQKDNPMSTCYPLKCQKIVNSSLFKLYDLSSPLNINLSDFNKVLFGCRSLHHYKVYKGSQKQDILTKNNQLISIPNKYFLIQDMHEKTYGSLESLSKFLNDNHFNIIFTFFNNAEAKKIKSLTPNCKHLHLPHHIHTSIFKDTNQDKIYDIMLFGSVHPSHYPFRKRLFDLIEANTNHFKVLRLEQPDTFDPERCEEGLADKLNKSRIAIATKSRYDYLVGKYFEIAACNCLVAGDMATDGIEIFKDNYLKLTDKMTDEQIIGTLRTALKYYNNWSIKRDLIKQHVNENYNLDKYLEKLILLLSTN